VVWQQHFGQGLRGARRMIFGVMGDPPDASGIAGLGWRTGFVHERRNWVA